jgi:hypothetical protein
MNALSEWLQLMLAEITRKQEDAAHARTEEVRRTAEEAGSRQPEDADRRKTFHTD